MFLEFDLKKLKRGSIIEENLKNSIDFIIQNLLNKSEMVGIQSSDLVNLFEETKPNDEYLGKFDLRDGRFKYIFEIISDLLNH